MPKEFRKIKKECMNCGKDLKLNNSRDIDRKNFCSRRCTTLFYLNRQQMGMFNKTHSEESKIKMSISANGKHCGEDNGRYINGRTSYRKLAMNNYPNECSLCGGFGKRLEVHHIDRDRNNNQLNNLIVLCSKCHFLVHKELEVENSKRA